MSNPNANVRHFMGGINAAAYWIGDHLLRGADIVNDSGVTGTTVKAALNTLSAASTAVFPFSASGLAEQDLVSYDATAGTWRNRTVEQALKGTGTDSIAIGTQASAAGTSSIAIGRAAGSVANTGNYNIAIGRGALNEQTGPTDDIVAIGNSAMSNGAATAPSTVAIGASSLLILGTGAQNVAVGSRSGYNVTTGSRGTYLGFQTLGSSSADDNTFVGNAISTISVGSRNSVLGSLAFNSASAAVTDIVALGYNALTGGLSTTAPSGSVAIGSGALSAVTTGLNTAIGFAAGDTLTTGTSNTIVGYDADATSNSRSGCVVLGRGASAAADDTLVIRMGNSSAKEVVLTPVVTTNVTAAIGTGTYIPISIGGVSYKIELKT